MNDFSVPDDTIQVRKRDGSVEPFVLAKVLRTIRRGLVVSGHANELDTSIAGGLGEAVHDYLKATYDKSTISSSQLSELVDLVLNQTGHSTASMAIHDYQRYREERRRRVRVAIPRDRGGFSQHRWSKASIVEFLGKQHLLDTPASRMIAGRVEQLIFGLGLGVVTSGLVREMITSELLGWGLLPAALAVKPSRRAKGARKVSDNRGP